MTKKLIYITMICMFMLSSIANAHIFFGATERDLECNGGTSHFIQPYKFWDAKSEYLYWSCDFSQLNSSESFKCVTHVHSGTSEEDNLIQTNPEDTFIEGVGLNNYFESQGDIALVFFTEKNLYVENQYLYEVECFTDSGLEFGEFERNVTVEYLSLGNVGGLLVFAGLNINYIIGGLFLFFILLVFLFYVKKGIL